MTTKILLSNMALMSSVLSLNIGKDSLYSLMLKWVLPTGLAELLVKASYFHSGKLKAF